MEIKLLINLFKTTPNQLISLKTGEPVKWQVQSNHTNSLGEKPNKEIESPLKISKSGKNQEKTNSQDNGKRLNRTSFWFSLKKGNSM